MAYLPSPRHCLPLGQAHTQAHVDSWNGQRVSITLQVGFESSRLEEPGVERVSESPDRVFPATAFMLQASAVFAL